MLPYDHELCTFYVLCKVHWCIIVITTSRKSCEFNIAIITSVICRELNLLRNIEATLLQRCEFDVAIPKSRRRCEFDVVIRKMQQSFQYKILSTPSVKQRWDVGVMLQSWRCGFNIATKLRIGFTTLPKIKDSKIDNFNLEYSGSEF